MLAINKSEEQKTGGRMSEQEQVKSISLDNLGFGGAVEQFNVEFEKVLANIIDENTSPELVREVQIKVKIKPNAERNFFSYKIEAKSKIAPINGVEGKAFLQRDQGKIKAFEPNEKQLSFVDLTKNNNIGVVEHG